MQSSLSELKAKLVGEWNTHLKSHSVKFPTSENRLIQLLCLYAFYPSPVSQDEMDEWIRFHGGKNNRQARHLAWDGWYIQTGNSKSTRMEISATLASDQLLLASLAEPNPVWAEFYEEQQRIKKSHPHFHKIVSIFSKRGCAMCGAKTPFLSPYSKIHSEKSKFDIAPLCKECNEWCVTRNITLQITDKLVARPLRRYGKTSESRSITTQKGVETRRMNKEKRSASALKGAQTKCNHSFNISKVKKKGGSKEGLWSIVIRGPKVSGKSGKKTLYCNPSIVHVRQKLMQFIGHYEIIKPKSGLPGILPDHDSDE